MEFKIPEGWQQDSHTLYLHTSGVRIERRIYKNKEGWMLVPVDLDRAVAEFAPNSEGLDQAFAAFAESEVTARGTPQKSKTKEAQEAARRDEKLEEASDDEETEKEKEDEDDA